MRKQLNVNTHKHVTTFPRPTITNLRIAKNNNNYTAAKALSVLRFLLFSLDVTSWQVLFLCINIKSGLLVGIWWYVFISMYPRILCVSFSRKNSGFGWHHQHGQVLISCTISSGLLFPPCHAYSTEPVCCIHLWFYLVWFSLVWLFCFTAYEPFSGHLTPKSHFDLV